MSGIIGCLVIFLRPLIFRIKLVTIHLPAACYPPCNICNRLCLRFHGSRIDLQLCADSFLTLDFLSHLEICLLVPINLTIICDGISFIAYIRIYSVHTRPIPLHYNIRCICW